MPEILGENADRLTTVEMRMKGMPRGYVHLLHEAARKHHQRPLGLLAAERLRGAISPGDRVVFTTGAHDRLWLHQGETDGPPGVAALAFTLAKGLAAVPILVSEEPNLGPILATTEAAGLSVMDFELARKRRMAAASCAFPTADEQGRRAAEEILDQYQPTAVVCCEKLGVNTKGVCHSVRGVCMEDGASLHHLVNGARQRSVLTISLADGGNEIGFGAISEAVRDIMPYGRKCQCPCGAGNADTTVVDALVIGAASNWAAYNVCACLAFLFENPKLLHSPETEWRMLDACVRAGAADAILASRELSVDGMPVEVHTSLITMLHTLVENALREVNRAY